MNKKPIAANFHTQYEPMQESLWLLLTIKLFQIIDFVWSDIGNQLLGFVAKIAKMYIFV